MILNPRYFNNDFKNEAPKGNLYFVGITEELGSRAFKGLNVRYTFIEGDSEKVLK